MAFSESGTVVITRADCDDIDALVQMFGRLHQLNASLNAKFDLAPDWEQVLRRQLAESRGEDRDAIWIARIDGEAIGFLTMEQQDGSPLFARQHWAELTGIFVSPDVRGSEVSHRLIAHAYAWAADRGLGEIRLFVTASNDRARAFYESEGFTHIQDIWSRPIIPGDHHDE